MKKYIALILMLVMIFALTACGDASKEQPEPTQDSHAEENDEPTYTISAAGLELKYPEKWQDKVTVAVEDDRVCFSCGDTKLFDLVFNKAEGAVLGTVKGEEYTTIYVVDYILDTEEKDLCAMQEDINVILSNLMKDYDFEVGVALEKEDTATFDIETDVVTMKYPAKWQDKVSIDVSEDGVRFSTDGTRLFDLMFVECDGYLLGTYKNTPIYIVDYSVETDEQSAMQEDVNVILQHLMEDSNFAINN